MNARDQPIVIDELGYLTVKPNQVNAFFRLMEQRYARVSTNGPARRCKC